MVVVGAVLTVAVVVLVAAAEVVDNADAIDVVVVDDVCTVDETVDGVTGVLSFGGFGELIGFGLSTLRGLALFAAAVIAAIAAADADPFVFGSFALATAEGVVAVVAVVPVVAVVAVVAAVAFTDTG